MTKKIKEKEENIQLAENEDVSYEDNINEYEKKRQLLEKTKITKQTWSILEIFQKIKSEQLILDPDYQRNEIWPSDKKTSFIESLFMEIIIPPIYVVEIPADDELLETKYEVVDGKQRLSAIYNFITNVDRLQKKSLEYYSDIFGDKTFIDIKESNQEYSAKIKQLLSSVLDVYVITANSPDFTKYDIFARLNKGAEKLKVNEIRRAIYRSNLTTKIGEFVEEKTKKDNFDKEYKSLFTDNDIKRFEDYGRFYRSIAFYMQSNIKKEIVDGYNSRPREMINKVLQDFQENKLKLSNEDITTILNKTIELLKVFKDINNKDYLVDACIPHVINNSSILFSKISKIKNDKTIKESLIKSPSTTTNVNVRLKRVTEIINE